MNGMTAEAGYRREPVTTSENPNPELRIPSPRQSWWTRCWQPIGTTIMDTAVLQEPRGFMRALQWLFAICAFGSCADFDTIMRYTVTCPNGDIKEIQHNATYPFVLSKQQTVNVTCGESGPAIYLDPPGDFSSDAAFFVFTGVISFLATMAILIVYVFFSPVYENESKKAPLVDFCFTVVIAVFWLSASAAWANGLSGMKHVYGGDWLHAANKCPFPPGGGPAEASSVEYAFTACQVLDSGHYGLANVSVILGFLNFFLWSSNLWFLYKETAWFASRNPNNESLEG
ncbi:synaptophysin-like protein 2 isoform X3 [Tigriopus californicus]|uniref:synaptophysin-like protein 2 isoform X3 n=1 Tax=Tigriopus californicus TaxID=6832 RepID=UPI0027DA18AC|nr:synaptophysin-like protein 2 isoform X3 [Tigriopus californicus]